MIELSEEVLEGWNQVRRKDPGNSLNFRLTKSAYFCGGVRPPSAHGHIKLTSRAPRNSGPWRLAKTRGHCPEPAESYRRADKASSTAPRTRAILYLFWERGSAPLTAASAARLTAAASNF